MMNVDNNDTELGLALGYSSIPSVQTRSNNNSGAGVNAGSGLNIAFVASNPLVELVWSPSKGLSLKCGDKKSAFLCDVGPSNTVCSPADYSAGSGGNNEEKPIVENTSILLQEDINSKNEVAKDAGFELALSPRNFGGLFGSSHECHTQNGDNSVEVNSVVGVKNVHFDQEHEYQGENEEESLYCPNNAQLRNEAETSGTNAGEGSRRTTGLLPLINNESKPGSRERTSKGSGRIEGVASASQPLDLEIALVHDDDPVSNLQSPGRRCTEFALAIEEIKNQTDTHGGDSSVPPLERMESSAENDSQNLLRRPGKDICLSSHTYVNERLSKDDDDSHESIESCSSAALFSKKKQLWSFEPGMIVGSKKMKSQIQDSPPASTFVRHDSSFMNWISNMIRGLPKSNQDEGPGPTFALDLGRPSQRLDSDDKRIVACNKTQDPGSRNRGFQTIFQSIYCPNTKVQETRELSQDYPSGSCKELGRNKKMGADGTQISGSKEDDKFCRQFLDKNKNSDCFTSEIGGPSSQPFFFPANLACRKGKDGVSSSDYFLAKEKSGNAENNLDSKSDGKGNQNQGYGNDPPGSLWITRFSMKTTSLDHCRQTTHGALEFPTDSKRLSSQTRNSLPINQKSSEARESLGEDPMNVLGRELKNEGPSMESSVGFKRVRGNDYQNSNFRLNPILSSQALKNSGAMASMFAKRLDAFKHIISSDIEHDETRSKNTTCYFCGRSGHDLRNCSEIKGTELEDLLGNIGSYGGTKEYRCLCIRCFQVDHWAISCPLASSSRQQQSKNGMGRRSGMMKINGSCSQFGGEDIICSNKKPRTDKLNAKMISDQRVSISGGAQKNNASRFGLDEEENQISPVCNFDRKEISDAPKGMFDMIRKLRLSRADILK
ncbi:hypothetical protein LguiB_025794 [Lonicera macranthoides]